MRQKRKQYSVEKNPHCPLACAVRSRLLKFYERGGIALVERVKRRLAGDKARSATTNEVKDLRHEARELKEVVAEHTLKRLPSESVSVVEFFETVFGLRDRRLSDRWGWSLCCYFEVGQLSVLDGGVEPVLTCSECSAAARSRHRPV
ncbi:hypothetical protein I9S53_08070 [Hyphomicrobium sulfonivorans]|nr:hypothetical protein [Hyphomicrobium sulfonivorans]